jgi:preprotein translocase subunit SecD
MKTLLYSIIAIFIFGIIAKGFTQKSNTNDVILIQATDSNISSVSLDQSADVISKRLKDFNPKKFTVNVIRERNQIEVILNGNWDVKVTESLIIQKGALAFYETYNRKSLSGLLTDDHHLFSLFESGFANDSTAEIGCCSHEEVGMIIDYLNTCEFNQKCKFAWSLHSDSSDVCLYALKFDKEKASLITGTDIESVTFHPDKKSKNNEIEIRMKESVVELWANATQRNINKAIAIVLDNHVLSAPIVYSSITGGYSTITGNFSQNEARYIATLVNSGELPLSFNVIK